jgi:hypothetical protein
VGRVGRLGLKGADNHRFDPGILDRARCSRSRLVPKTFKPTLGEAPTPLADRIGIDTQADRNNLALLAVSTAQNDPSPQRQALRRASARGQRPQLTEFNLIQRQRSKPSTHRQSSPNQEGLLSSGRFGVR